GYPDSVSPNALDWAYEEVRWWSHWLGGDATTGIMDEPMLRALMPYATRRQSVPEPIPGRWIAEQQWPTGRLGERLYLNADGLGTEPQEGEPLTVPSDVVVGQALQEWYGEAADE